MIDVSAALDDLAYVLGAVASVALVANQIFGTGGLLDTGWSSRVRAIAVLRLQFPEFGKMYSDVSVARPKGWTAQALIFASSFAPLVLSQAIIHIPGASSPEALLATGASIAALFIGLSGWTAKLGSRLESRTDALSDSDRVRLRVARFLQGRLVLVWINFPIFLAGSTAQLLARPVTPDTVWLLGLSLALAVGGTLWFAFATMESLMAIEDAVYVDFLHTAKVEPRVRVSLRDAAGGHHTVRGKLRYLGKECVVDDEEGFTERLMWHQVARLATSSQPVGPERSDPDPQVAKDSRR